MMSVFSSIFNFEPKFFSYKHTRNDFQEFKHPTKHKQDAVTITLLCNDIITGILDVMKVFFGALRLRKESMRNIKCIYVRLSRSFSIMHHLSPIHTKFNGRNALTWVYLPPRTTFYLIYSCLRKYIQHLFARSQHF